MAKQRGRAATTRLSEGQNSIDRASVTVVKDKQGRAIHKRLGWSILLPGDAEPTRRFTQGGTRETDTAIRTRAHEKAIEMLDDHRRGAATGWTRRSSMKDYCDAVVRPEIKAAHRLSKRTKTAYLASLDLLVGGCEGSEKERHRHRDGLGGKTILAATRFLAVESCLQEISRLHGREVAHRSRSVLTGWVMRSLRRHELMDHNPIKGETIDIRSMARVHEVARSGETVALSRSEYDRAVQHLLELDPAKGIIAPKRGRWGLEHRVTMRRNMIALTLIQAGTGLRISEARQAWRGLVHDQPEGMTIDVDASIAKGGVPRLAHVLDDRVLWRIRELLLVHPDDADDVLLVGQAGDRHKVWDLAKVRDEARVLYDQVAEELDIPALATRGHLTHIWRATMNMQLMAAGIPPAARAQQLGHTEQVALDYYTAAMPAEMAAGARAIISG